MYNEISSLSKIHGKQFYDGLFSDLKKYGHKDYQKPYFEYRLGREYYINTEEVLNEIFRIEKKIFRIDEDRREIWFYRYILKSLTDYDIDKYILIYKSNKIENDIT